MHPNNQRLSEDTTWQEWEKHYAHALEHPAGYELKFVRTVLQPLDLQPCDVIPQYYFRDSNGKDRYIDFMIIVEEDVFLPIELDGLSKMIDYDSTHEERYERFNDFLFRQNEIVGQFGYILRYSNKYWFSYPNKVIDEIRSVLFGLTNQYIRKLVMQETIDDLTNQLQASHGQIQYQDRYIEYEVEIEPRYPKVSPSLFGFIWVFIRYGWRIGYNHLHSYMKYKLDTLDEWWD